jgi:hypothetical protein
MDEQAQVGRSRRALLAGAAGAAAAMVVESLGRPAPALAESAMMTNVTNHAANQTSIDSPQTADSTAVFAAYPTDTKARIYALFGETKSPAGYGVYGYSAVDGVGIEGRSAVSTGVIGLSGPDEVAPIDGTGVYGRGTKVGVRALGTGQGSTGIIGQAPGTGVFGYSSQSPTGAGVSGQADFGVGVAATSTAGTALKVTGKARFNRSGRVSVARNRAYVDVDLTALGGLGAKALCFANLAYPRSGVYVRAVRPNYPGTGKMRIYLNKVASTTASTSLSWLVLEGE